MTTKLETVIQRAGDDDVFRQAILKDPDAALASAGFTLGEDDRAVLDEYRRVAASMTEAQLKDAIRDYVDAAKQGKLAAGAG